MKKIKLSQGKFALVSDIDYVYLNQWKWCAIKRRNLRPATTRQNRTQQINNKSGIKGVSWRKDRSKWRATIKINGKQTHLGYFNDPLIAARAYNRAAKRYHGKFARVTHPFGV